MNGSGTPAREAGRGIRVAMWSGPRNISTAMLRSWGNRPDTFACDEPFYAHYLKVTGTDHPGREEVIGTHESDPAKVIAWLTGPIPEGKEIFFQKQMAHHLLPGMDRSWLTGTRHAFLIRDPSEMLASLARVMREPGLLDTGLPQQVEIFRRMIAEWGRVPPVVDARDVLTAPEPMLRKLCDALGVAFRREMLSWPAGPKPYDGVWAKHWYAAVNRSTGFEPYRAPAKPLPDRLRALRDACLPFYAELHAHRIAP